MPVVGGGAVTGLGEVGMTAKKVICPTIDIVTVADHY